MRRNLKITAIVAIIVILASTFVVFLGINDFSSLETLSPSRQYLSYQGNVSKIFLVSATAGYGSASETYNTIDGQVVQKGSSLFIINVTLRNDYTLDDPPPPKGIPISPADGTAYVYLTAQLNNEEGIIKAIDVTVPDFSIPLTPGAALILASGQTASVNIYLAVNETNIIDYDIKAIFIGDSIPI
jgi:hypothetical protein